MTKKLKFIDTKKLLLNTEEKKQVLHVLYEYIIYLDESLSIEENIKRRLARYDEERGL
jgi:hypothetical protein